LNDNNFELHRIGDSVPILHQPSLETFLRDFLKPQLPVKITGKVQFNIIITYYVCIWSIVLSKDNELIRISLLHHLIFVYLYEIFFILL